jgi:hypothetical protein
LPPTTLVLPRLISFSSPANQKREERREPVTTTVCAQVLKSSSGLRSTRSIEIVVKDKRKFASVVEGAFIDDEDAAVGGLFVGILVWVFFVEDIFSIVAVASL